MTERSPELALCVRCRCTEEASATVCSKCGGSFANDLTWRPIRAGAGGELFTVVFAGCWAFVGIPVAIAALSFAAPWVALGAAVSFPLGLAARRFIGGRSPHRWGFQTGDDRMHGVLLLRDGKAPTWELANRMYRSERSSPCDAWKRLSSGAVTRTPDIVEATTGITGLGGTVEGCLWAALVGLAARGQIALEVTVDELQDEVRSLTVRRRRGAARHSDDDLPVERMILRALGGVAAPDEAEIATGYRSPIVDDGVSVDGEDSSILDLAYQLVDWKKPVEQRLDAAVNRTVMTGGSSEISEQDIEAMRCDSDDDFARIARWVAPEVHGALHPPG